MGCLTRRGSSQVVTSPAIPLTNMGGQRVVCPKEDFSADLFQHFCAFRFFFFFVLFEPQASFRDCNRCTVEDGCSQFIHDGCVVVFLFLHARTAVGSSLGVAKSQPRKLHDTLRRSETRSTDLDMAGFVECLSCQGFAHQHAPKCSIRTL